MKKILCFFIMFLLIIFLFIQGKDIYKIILFKKNLENQNIADVPAVQKTFAIKSAINIAALFDMIYKEDKSFKVINIVLNGDRTVAEVEVDIDGSISYVEEVIGDMKDSEGFAGIKKYVEREGEPKKIYLLFNIKE